MEDVIQALNDDITALQAEIKSLKNTIKAEEHRTQMKLFGYRKGVVQHFEKSFHLEILGMMDVVSRLPDKEKQMLTYRIDNIKRYISSAKFQVTQAENEYLEKSKNR